MTPRQPKYQQIFDILKADILANKYFPRQRLPSEAAFMEQFGASRITVVRALKELQHEGLIERRAGSGTYVIEAQQKSTSLIFGLLIPNLSETEIFGPICQSIADSLQTRKHGLLWGNMKASDQATQSLKICEHYINQKVAGVFFAPLELSPHNDEINREVVKILGTALIPIVLLDRCFLPYPQRSSYDLVSVDHRRAGYQITKHLIDLGCQKIAFVAHANSASTIEARLAGYQEALLKAGHKLVPELIQRLSNDRLDEIGLLMQQGKPDAVVCANDRTAGQVMRKLLELGYKIPQDVQIIGIDDVQYANLLPVPLTTAHQPCEDLGIVAVSAMMERIALPAMSAREILLSSHIVIRESSR
jgi:GntR family transcriptional regulator, arabinose operon transcriptional repressor